MCVRECYEGDNERESELRVVGLGSILCEIIKSMVHEEIIRGKRGVGEERKRDRNRESE